MLDFDAITAAVWANDSRADEGLDLPAIFKMLGVDESAASYIAEQRALRIVMLQRGEWTAMSAERIRRDAYEQIFRKVKLTPREQGLIAVMATLWLDGFAAGVHAERNKDQS